jgi:hypothetical protein
MWTALFHEMWIKVEIHSVQLELFRLSFAFLRLPPRSIPAAFIPPKWNPRRCWWLCPEPQSNYLPVCGLATEANTAFPELSENPRNVIAMMRYDVNFSVPKDPSTFASHRNDMFSDPSDLALRCSTAVLQFEIRLMARDWEARKAHLCCFNCSPLSADRNSMTSLLQR